MAASEQHRRILAGLAAVALVCVAVVVVVLRNNAAEERASLPPTFIAHRAEFECLRSLALASGRQNLNAATSAEWLAQCKASQLARDVQVAEGWLLVTVHGHRFRGYNCGLARYVGDEAPAPQPDRHIALLPISDGWYAFFLKFG